MPRRKSDPEPEPSDAQAMSPQADPPTAGADAIENAQIPAGDPGSPQFASGAAGPTASGGSRIVEVQFRPGASGLAAAQARSVQGLLQAAASGAAPPGGLTTLQEVL